MGYRDTGDARSGVAKALLPLVVATAAEAAIVIGHFVYSARLYDDPYRAHPVTPVLVALGLVVALAAAYWRKGWSAALWLLVATVGLPFIVIGAYHGGFSHVVKLVMYAAGTSPEQLQDIFDSPDFAVPNDFAFEASGVLCFVAAAVVSWALVRLLRVARHGRRGGSVPTPAVQDA
jgi:hypothetical protein